MTVLDNQLSVDTRLSARVHNAKRFFGQASRYLTRNYRIPIRAQILKDLLGNVRDADILDLGCGDGSISAQFLHASNRVTMVDFSFDMLEQARKTVPADCTSRVQWVHEDILQFEPPAQYDVVLCIGVLAHVDSLEATIGRVARMVKPGGRVAFQITDDDQPLVRWWKWMYAGLNVVSRASLRWQGMTRSEVIAIAARRGLMIEREQRHLLLLFPGMARILGKWLLPYDAFTRKRAWLARYASNVILVCRKDATPA
jgi:2-polyprenyl-3-methyl-5-hydroxy-6-metoxy-1,4-benzoquinol methylase